MAGKTQVFQTEGITPVFRRQAAGLRALSAVPAPPADERGKQALSRVGDAERPVDKDFDGSGCVFDRRADIFFREFPREHDLGKPEVGDLDRARRAVERELGGRVQRQLGQMLPQIVREPDIGRNHAVDTQTAQGLGVSHRVGEFGLIEQGVHRDIDPDPACMGGGETAGEGLVIEVLGIGARAELLAPELDGVRSRYERGVKRLFTPCRCEQFR